MVNATISKGAVRKGEEKTVIDHSAHITIKTKLNTLVPT